MGSRFDLPSQSDLTEIHRKIVELNRRVDDSTALLNTTTMRLKDFLREIQRISQHSQAIENQVSLLELYKLFITKERLLFTNMNKLKHGEKLSLGYCWVPKADGPDTFDRVQQIKAKNRNIELPNFKLMDQKTLKPPTMFKNNAFTTVF